MCSWKMRGARQLRGPLVLCKQQRMPFGGFVLLKALGPRGGQQAGQCWVPRYRTIREGGIVELSLVSAPFLYSTLALSEFSLPGVVSRALGLFFFFRLTTWHARS